MSMQKNSKTVDKYGGVNHTPEKENINAYRVKGEILTAIQEPGFIGGISTIGVAALIGGKTGGLYGGLGGALLGGGLISLTPESVGKKHDMDGGVGNPIARHGIEQVLPCIELEKQHDEALLSKI